MNLISFKGRTMIIRDFASWLFGGPEEGAVPGAGVSAGFKETLSRVARERSVPIETLNEVIDFLARHGARAERILELIEERADELAGLAQDVALLERYRSEGIIRNVRIIEECE